jgi:pimeloyl-ACP methyl ester carboxylesterase
MNYVITLVHGTWARNAPWTDESSPLCQTLSAVLPGLKKFAPFPWSGRNSHQGRLDAGRDLERHVRQLIREYPSAKHYIIAHSHGGNVALYALRDEDLQRQIAGVVCLSTPFLSFGERHLGMKAPIYMRNAFFLLLLPMAVYLYDVIPPDPGVWGVPPLPANPTLWQWWNHCTNAGFNIVFYTFVLGLFLFGLIDLSGSLSRWNPLHAMHVAKERQKPLMLPAMTRTRLLIIRVSGDEASSALIAAQFTGWLLGETWKLVQRVTLRIIPDNVREFTKDALFVSFGAFFLLSVIAVLFPDQTRDAMLRWLRRAWDIELIVIMPLILLAFIFPALMLLLSLGKRSNAMAATALS